MKPNRILFITAGGKAKKQELGLGHVYRTINLAKQFQKRNVFFLVEDYGGSKKIFSENNFNKNIFSIKPKLLFKEHLNMIKKIIYKYLINTIIVDKYKISQSYIDKLRNLAKVVVVRDLQEINFEADILVNGFIGFKNQKYTNKIGTKFLLGPKYQILNKSFSQKHTKNSKSIDILATFGGFDEKNISDILAVSLESFISKLTIKVIQGPVASKSKKLLSLQKKYPKNLIVIQKTRDMAKEIQNAKFGICSGGLTTYEFAALGVPFGIICDEDHQLITAKEWSKHKIAKNLGLINPNSDKKIKKLIKNFVDDLIVLKKKSNTVDGLGAKRVANEILKI